MNNELVTEPDKLLTAAAWRRRLAGFGPPALVLLGASLLSFSHGGIVRAAGAMFGGSNPRPAAGAPLTARMDRSVPTADRTSLAVDAVGLAAKDWASIRREYQRHRHAAVLEEGSYRARNYAQQWLTYFDGRGFTVVPDSGLWTWGLALERYGFAGQERAVTGPARVTNDFERVGYAWEEMEEWFVNGGEGLEHGFTLRNRPPGAADGGLLRMHLGVRGGLMPRVEHDGRAVSFTDAAGQPVVTYSGLRVWDVDGRVMRAGFEAEVNGGIRLAIDEAGARYPLTIDPIAQQAYLKASNARTMGGFGVSLALSGDTLVIGAVGESSNATGVNGNQTDNSAAQAGAAYVFVRSGGTWTQQAYLKASNTGPGDQFGGSVAISGDTVVVGANQEDSNATGVNNNQADNSAANTGAVYVFVRTSGAWSQQAYLKASNAGVNDFFGNRVSLSGDTVVVGASAEDSNATGVNGDQADDSAISAGAVYVFVRNGGTWSQQAYLKALSTEAGDVFGSAVAVSGDTVVVAAAGEDSNATGVNGDQADNSAADAGAVYVFARSEGSWSQQAYLKASNTAATDRFGTMVAVWGDTLVVGANREDSNATGVNGDETNDSAIDSGAAYVFVRGGGTWSQQAYLKASNTGAGDRFGNAVAVYGNRIVVGAEEDSNSTGVDGNGINNSALNAGAAYLFVRSGATWSQQAYLKASNTGAGDGFGAFVDSIAVSDDAIVVGAVNEDSNAVGVNGNQADNSAQSAGAAYVFSVPPAPDVTLEFSITRSVVTLNRATNRYRQTVTLRNNGPALASAAYVADYLPSGVAMYLPDGTTAASFPAASPYKELGAVGAGATVTVTIEFSRTGTQVITYTSRVLGAGPR